MVPPLSLIPSRIILSLHNAVIVYDKTSGAQLADRVYCNNNTGTVMMYGKCLYLDYHKLHIHSCRN